MKQHPLAIVCKRESSPWPLMLAMSLGMVGGAACGWVGTQHGIAQARERNNAELRKAATMIEALKARCAV